MKKRESSKSGLLAKILGATVLAGITLANFSCCSSYKCVGDVCPVSGDYSESEIAPHMKAMGYDSMSSVK